ncbi:AAA family ATPase [Micromonospora aurantiaca (nom. illeg.)]|uniref:AAA family ATPase n=1 Tax=Micromonospora aurantiaca (nom. illeg.) TaxID=47850 RepID=UPI00082762DA|nr:AAA family ATPase [Micromonospora aurantiaca]SCL28470.1 RecF/RecN/SMC N terminal domain-containing protein [Micromonospora aurantiaca]
MRLSRIHLRNFKRFTDTTICDIPDTARLIVLAGPNGSGKSSIFDGLKTWHRANGASYMNWDESYGSKAGAPSISWTEHVQVDFHEGLPDGPEERKRLVYVRTAFRNEADFQVNSFTRMESPLESTRVQRMIDNDAAVSENYQRLIMATIDGVYDRALPDSMTKGELRDRVIGKVRVAMSKVFPDLMLTGVGGVGGAQAGVGTFFFSKGVSDGFLYKNLSAGEKAAFDLILDMVVKSETFDNTVWCIDEPETHLNTRIQATLLAAMVELLPEKSQLVIASHSIGFMRKARELSRAEPGSVVFIDLQGVDFDQPVVLIPVEPTRDFWSRTLDVALGDLASLVAPERIVLCEGRPLRKQNDRKAEFDASCYRRIFAREFPDTDFISVGNSHSAGSDHLDAGRAIQTVAAGTKITRVIDRDLRSDQEVEDLRTVGVRVLSRRHIESFLFDDEIIALLCERVGLADRVSDALRMKQDEIAASVARGNDSDDIKSAAGAIGVGLRRLLSLTSAGSDVTAFARDTLAPLIAPDTATYLQLKRDIFGDL